MSQQFHAFGSDRAFAAGYFGKVSGATISGFWSIAASVDGSLSRRSLNCMFIQAREHYLKFTKIFEEAL